MTLTFSKKDSSKNPRQIRVGGNIPVTIYGKKVKESLSLQITTSDYKKFGLANCIQVINGQTEESGNYSLLIKAIEIHPLSKEVLNIQFQAIDPEQRVKVTIPVHYEGVSPAVQAGGILFLNKKSVELTCLAKNIPSSLSFSLSKLTPANVIVHYYDLELPEGALLRSDAKQIIAKVSMPQTKADSAA